ncbi:pyrroline-5-carboxylate reductase [Thiomicrospira sp. R3]|uniref:pyrroline-5-carboxylate reductase n=1 Tax=Thiomicrospira sp. R3 TaxID=3035472 RepID=UPI00259B5EA6|nr:pyrroline-5-carboxylate reductase [Thiomicrospira sp. R3]WFE69042.1 pyrroline-5-carboxylate reductase [Thiomicrospira sp. R3]
MQAKICFIGAGNMSRSLIGGLIQSGYPANQIWAADPSPQALESLKQSFSIKGFNDNLEAIDSADIIVLAVKPQQLKPLCQSIAAKVQQTKPLIISVAAGVQTASINSWLGSNQSIVRTMPNTPALIQTGATGLFASNNITPLQKDEAENILRAAGLTIWVTDEAQLDIVTALSGSGPAYFFLFMEAMQSAGEKLGLDRKTAELLTMQTAFGAAKMALESDDDCATLRRKVTSPNGTTERAIQSFEQNQLTLTVEKAMQAAHQRAQQLAKELGE